MSSCHFMQFNCLFHSLIFYTCFLLHNFARANCSCHLFTSNDGTFSRWKLQIIPFVLCLHPLNCPNKKKKSSPLRFLALFLIFKKKNLKQLYYLLTFHFLCFTLPVIKNTIKKKKRVKKQTDPPSQIFIYFFSLNS